ncbi:12398_t:CDS:1, partial [Funneliformis geosporum]
MNVCHNNSLVTQDLNQDLQVYTIEGSQEINTKYQKLSDFLLEKNVYEFFDLEEYVPSDLMQKYHYIKDLQLNFP